MPKRSNDYRAEVWRVLSDGKWHTGLELVQVGGMRAPARVHELRRGADGMPPRRILCKVEDSCSSYRWTCDCGPLPDEPGPETPYCEACRAALAEIGDPVKFALEAPPAAAEEPKPAGPGGQLGLFKGAA